MAPLSLAARKRHLGCRGRDGVIKHRWWSHLEKPCAHGSFARTSLKRYHAGQNRTTLLFGSARNADVARGDRLEHQSRETPLTSIGPCRQSIKKKKKNKKRTQQPVV